MYASKKQKRMCPFEGNTSSRYCQCDELQVLEEQVAVVLDVSLQVELVHETTGSLHGLLLKLLSLLLGIELDTGTLLAVDDLEQVSTGITLDDAAAELTSLG